MLRLAAKNFCDRLYRLTVDQRGASAVEFAMVLPLMVALYFGAVELSEGIGISRKVSLTARTVADLVARVSSINNAGMTDVLNASTAVMAPYSTTPLRITVSSVKIDANGRATIDWSDTRNGTARAVGSTVTLPGALVIPNTSLIWSEVQYDYRPAVGYVITGTLTLKDQLFMSPRVSSSVTRTVN